jgi:predicted HAD superfamily hydrolase
MGSKNIASTMSFDVFDTVLVRVWATPVDAIMEVARRLKAEGIISSTPKKWCEQRQRAEREMRQGGNYEPTIKEIYARIGQIETVNPLVLDRALNKEIEVEIEGIRANPIIKKIIDQQHTLGRRVLYLSDMYLPSTVIERMLKSAQVWGNGDRLYVSCECGASKFQGTLFKYCLAQEKLHAGDLCHFGDNEYSDVCMPRKLGIEARLASESWLNKNERLILRCSKASGRLTSLVVGASRLARLSCNQAASKMEKIIWDTGASVVGPAFFGFAAWCLAQANERRLGKLYFISRDGQIFLRMAEILNKSMRYQVECRYLYGSRQAWFLPSIVKIEEVDWEWILENTHIVTVAGICRRVDISVDQIRGALDLHGLGAVPRNENLGYAERECLRAAMQEDSVKILILEAAKVRREMALRYLQQEGLAEGVLFGVVDIGWNGRLQRSLSRLLLAGEGYPANGIDGYYFCLNRRAPSPSPMDRLHAFFWDGEAEGQETRESVIHSALIERFAAADHGGVTGYTYEGGAYVPQLRSGAWDDTADWPVAAQQGGAVEFTRQISDLVKAGEFTLLEWAQIAEVSLDAFVNQPTNDEASVYGAALCEEDQGGGGRLAISPPYGARDALKYIFTGRNRHHCVWIAGARRRGTPLARVLLSEKCLRVRRKWLRVKAIWNWYQGRLVTLFNGAKA